MDCFRVFRTVLCNNLNVRAVRAERYRILNIHSEFAGEYQDVFIWPLCFLHERVI